MSNVSVSMNSVSVVWRRITVRSSAQTMQVGTRKLKGTMKTWSTSSATLKSVPIKIVQRGSKKTRVVLEWLAPNVNLNSVGHAWENGMAMIILLPVYIMIKVKPTITIYLLMIISCKSTKNHNTPKRQRNRCFV